MLALKVKIISFVDDSQPGWVRCSFKDIFGQEYFVTEKIPHVTREPIDETSNYPKDGIIYCTIEIELLHENTVSINISKPINVETEDGEIIFNVFKNQLVEVEQ